MSSLYLATVVGLLIASAALVSAAPVNMLDRLATFLEQNENREMAQMADIDQKEADNQFYKDQEDTLTQMILKMLMNQQVEKESMTGTQDNKQAVKQTPDHQDKEDITFIQSMYDKLSSIEEEIQEIAQALNANEKMMKIQRG